MMSGRPIRSPWPRSGRARRACRWLLYASAILWLLQPPYMYRVSEEAPDWAGLAVLGIFGVLPPLALYLATLLFED